MLGVQNQVQRRLLEKLPVQQAQRQVPRQSSADHDGFGRGVRFVEVAQLVDDRVQIGRLELEILHPRKPQKTLENAVQPVDLGP